MTGGQQRPNRFSGTIWLATDQFVLKNGDRRTALRFLGKIWLALDQFVPENG